MLKLTSLTCRVHVQGFIALDHAYQDHLTKCCAFRPLTFKRHTEVAGQLVIRFLQVKKYKITTCAAFNALGGTIS